MDKQQAFLELVKDVQQCRVCSDMLVTPHSSNSECLLNDDHGLNTDKPYVNLWNRWHGDLDADIMVIGQDFGEWEDADTFARHHTASPYANPTNQRLYKLFRDVMEIDIDTSQTRLFFTNAANCYRKKKTTGGMHIGWLPICSHRYMARLITIIRPKLIIVLGRAAFEAIYCMDGLSVTCQNPLEKVNNTFADMIRHEYNITVDGQSIPVFPVYHPGANSKRNRSEEEQKCDWKRIKEEYDKVKNHGKRDCS